MLENKEFKIEIDSSNDNHIALIHKHRRWSGWWIHKDQLNALIEILNQLKKETDGERTTV